MSDYTVIWAGRGAMPHEEHDRQYWATPESYLTKAANVADMGSRNRLPGQREMRGKTTLTGPQIRQSIVNALSPRPRCACGRGLSKSEVSRRCTRCWYCREKGISMRRPA